NLLRSGYSMLYTKAKKEALSIYEHAVEKYNNTYQTMQETGSRLYSLRQDSVKLIQEIELLLNSIANKPKEFEKTISDIQAEQKKFRDAEEYAAEAMKAAVKSGISVAAGVAGGAAVASMAPSAAMWVATTFGTASTGTAISTLSGAAATKAALAWLGGGALSAGGAGVAGGQALLALAGPIGWGITGVTTAASVVALGHKNKKIADEAIAEAKKITIAGAEVNESSAKIQHLIDETVMLMDDLRDMSRANTLLRDANYLELSEKEQYRLGAMVNSTLALAEMLNKTI
ncbi:hypothetical protein, partial [Intestinimonas sp. HCP28S3_D6]|uniref:hypothetical protein n=1 Tax=Intestinimonas sp. HCP28S3_D6 TaxID=3438942 RepID=UPI003F89D4AB